MYMLAGFVLLLVLSYAQAQNAKCNYAISVIPDRIYHISSPNYPYSYYPGVACRWIGVCPNGYKCRVDCGDIDLPQTASCTMDRLLISKSGDPQLTNAQYYCGRGTLTAVSQSTQISLGLVTSRNSPGGRFSCDLYAQVDNTPTCNCGYRKMNRIVGGQETRPNEYPMMAGVVYVGENTIKCGAVIIDHSYVLTAAHCVANKTLNQIAVVVGEHDVTTGSDSPDLQAFKVSRIISHEQFNPNTYDNDIAILQLLGSIVYSNNVGPVCLPFKFANNDFTGASVTILGWGTTFPGGPDSKRLRKVNVDVISQASCRRSVSTLTSRQMCTYTQGKDACQDDSGGPLLYPDPSNGRLYNVGVVSFGRFCASGSPGINTRITAFLNWIVTKAPANYCRI